MRLAWLGLRIRRGQKQLAKPRTFLDTDVGRIIVYRGRAPDFDDVLSCPMLRYVLLADGKSVMRIDG